ncbi:MAG TPA: hypothetical protein VM243_02250 [Phycisphaerae bacterium]|nr:hypothetical protein [Phycisphaerae bacterium]
MKATAHELMRRMAVIVLVTIGLSSAAAAQEPTFADSRLAEVMAQSLDRSQWDIQREQEAIARARALVDASGRFDSKATARLVVLSGDNTPFLSDQIIERPIWHVVLGDWNLKLKSAPPGAEDLYLRTFDVFVDPQGGQLLKIVSRWPKGVARIPREPGAKSVTQQLRRAGHERYHAFPDEAPRITFLEALDAMTKGGENPLAAKQIVGQYVVWSMMGRKPRPMWVISLRGVPALGASYPGVAVNARDHFRSIVDPQTGKWVCGFSTPQPQTTEEPEIEKPPQ